LLFTGITTVLASSESLRLLSRLRFSCSAADGIALLLVLYAWLLCCGATIPLSSSIILAVNG
jgi:hypothetical protein